MSIHTCRKMMENFSSLVLKGTVRSIYTRKCSCKKQFLAAMQNTPETLFPVKSEDDVGFFLNIA